MVTRDVLVLSLLMARAMRRLLRNTVTDQYAGGRSSVAEPRSSFETILVPASYQKDISQLVQGCVQHFEMSVVKDLKK